MKVIGQWIRMILVLVPLHELCAKMNRNYRMCDMAASFDRGPYHQRQFNKWMWENLYDNRCCFPTLGCLCNLVRLKHELWNRYGFFFDVDVLQRYFLKMSLASWVMKAYDSLFHCENRVSR